MQGVVLPKLPLQNNLQAELLFFCVIPLPSSLLWEAAFVVTELSCE